MKTIKINLILNFFINLLSFFIFIYFFFSHKNILIKNLLYIYIFFYFPPILNYSIVLHGSANVKVK